MQHREVLPQVVQPRVVALELGVLPLGAQGHLLEMAAQLLAASRELLLGVEPQLALAARDGVHHGGDLLVVGRRRRCDVLRFHALPGGLRASVGRRLF